MAKSLIMFAVFLTLSARGSGQWPAYSDEKFRDEVAHRAFFFFLETSNPTTGLTQDRANLNGSSNDMASLASTGWYLASLPIGVERDWISYDLAHVRALNAVHFLYGDRADGKAMPNTHGFFRHYADKNTGASSSEVSTLDSALCVVGAIICGEYFGGEVLKTANLIYERVDWEWARTRAGHVPDSQWVPYGYEGGPGENDRWGFIRGDYAGYNEALPRMFVTAETTAVIGR